MRIKMTELLNIAHPFLSVEDFRRRVGHRLARLIHRLASKYPQLQKSCGTRRMLLALSVAWGLTDFAQAGNTSAFEHIDEALSPTELCGCVRMPSCGCVMVSGQPYFLAEGESMLRFLWDGFALFIDNQGTDAIVQHFFDFADRRQSKAYDVMGEDCNDSEEINDASSSSETSSTAETASTAETSVVLASQKMPSDAEATTSQEMAEERTAIEQMAGERTTIKQMAEERTTIKQMAGERTALEQMDEDNLVKLTKTTIRIGDMQEVKNLEHLLGLMVGNVVADRCREMLMVWRMERNNRVERPNEFHFDGSVGQFIARGDGNIDQFINRGHGNIDQFIDRGDG